jgi:hypothetical protein
LIGKKNMFFASLLTTVAVVLTVAPVAVVVTAAAATAVEAPATDVDADPIAETAMELITAVLGGNRQKTK